MLVIYILWLTFCQAYHYACEPDNFSRGGTYPFDIIIRTPQKGSGQLPIPT